MLIFLAALTMMTDLPAVTSQFRNGSFHNGLQGWSLTKESISAGYRLAIVDGHARVTVDREVPGYQLAIVQQNIAAEPFRGQRVVLLARARITGTGAAGLRLVALHDDPQRLLVRTATPQDALPADGRWHYLRVHGRIGRDADRIRLLLYAVGNATADFDDVRLENWHPKTTPMAPAAKAMLDKALAFIREKHINARANKAWPKLEAQAREDAAGAGTASDVEPAITALLGDLNEHHASLETPDDARLGSGVNTSASSKPSVSLLNDRYGLVQLPAFNINGTSDAPAARAYVELVRGGLAQLDKSPICGWIVDLRGNSGGTTFVPVNAISGLARFDKKDWPEEYPVDETELRQFPPELRWMFTMDEQKLAHASLPVAVLIDKRTASAAEDTALRFSGRNATRSFGEPSAGFVSGNEPSDLGNGWRLVVPTGYMHDRFGNATKERILPDVTTSRPLEAAKAWLARPCGVRFTP